MTTLTSSSPSPAASPRAAFHIQSQHSNSHHHLPRQQRPISSPRQSLRQPPYTVPKTQSVNAPPALATLRKDRPPNSDEHGPEIFSERYVDAGTQYSPDGSPPTSHRRPNVAITASLQPPGSTGSAKKRKEFTRSESPPRQMSPSSSSASSSAGPTAQITQQSALHLQSAVASSSSRTGGVPVRDDGGPRPGEPQEARSTHGHSSAPKRSKPEPGTVKIMPLKYETCAPKDLGVLISNMLMELIRLNDQIPLRDGRLTRFHSRAPPGISVSDYLQRLIQHATLSPPILLSMVYYIDRLCALYTPFTINSLTVHRFLITAATVAAKGLSDSFWTNPTYARIGGIPVSELATLELEFLQKVDWKIVPKPETLEEYYRSLVDRTQGYELEVPARSDSTSLDESTDSPRLDGDADGDDEMGEEPA